MPTTPQPEDEEKSALEKAYDKVVNAFAGVTGSGAPGKSADSADAFFLAVTCDRIEEARGLIEAGFDPNSYNAHGDTALHLSARRARTAMAQMLLEHGADPRRGKKSDASALPMLEAISFGKAEMIGLLARYGGGDTLADSDGWTMLHKAAEKGKDKLVEALMNAGFDGNARTDSGSTPLLIALRKSRDGAAQKLLAFNDVASGINNYCTETDPAHLTAFQVAVERGAAQLIALMLPLGANANAADGNGLTPLDHAIEHGSLETIRLLVSFGADVNRTAGSQGLPLYAACETRYARSERPLIAGFLLESGADVDAKDAKTGSTALHAAVRADDGLETVKVLLRHAPDLEARDRDGITPLSCALARSSWNMAGLLLEAGADVNARYGIDAATPLIQAVRGHAPLSLIETLIARGADASQIDSHGKSALSYAREAARTGGGKLQLIALLDGALMTALLQSNKKTKHRAKGGESPAPAPV